MVLYRTRKVGKRLSPTRDSYKAMATELGDVFSRKMEVLEIPHWWLSVAFIVSVFWDASLYVEQPQETCKFSAELLKK